METPNSSKSDPSSDKETLEKPRRLMKQIKDGFIHADLLYDPRRNKEMFGAVRVLKIRTRHCSPPDQGFFACSDTQFLKSSTLKENGVKKSLNCDAEQEKHDVSYIGHVRRRSALTKIDDVNDELRMASTVNVKVELTEKAETGVRGKKSRHAPWDPEEVFDVQSIFNGGSDCGWAYVYYEGWDPDSGGFYPLRDLDCQERITKLHERNNAFDAVEKYLFAKRENRSTFHRPLITQTYVPTNSSLFWEIDDIEFKHNAIHLKDDLNRANIHYTVWMHLDPKQHERIVANLNFEYTNANKLSRNARAVMERMAHRKAATRSALFGNCTCFSEETLQRLDKMDKTVTKFAANTTRSYEKPEARTLKGEDMDTVTDVSEGEETIKDDLAKRTTSPQHLKAANRRPQLARANICDSEDSSCCFQNVRRFAEDATVDWVKYNTDGTLNLPDEFPQQVLMAAECTPYCGCGDSCHTKVVQKGTTTPLLLFLEGIDKGWGVRAMAPIKRGQFVVEYVGEVITPEEAEERVHTYIIATSNPMFQVDATAVGNIARFINHCCTPNLVTVQVACDEFLEFPRIAFFAYRDIEPGEELSFCYWPHFLEDAQRTEEKFTSRNSLTCRCQSDGCWGRIPSA